MPRRLRLPVTTGVKIANHLLGEFHLPRCVSTYFLVPPSVRSSWPRLPHDVRRRPSNKLGIYFGALTQSVTTKCPRRALVYDKVAACQVTDN
jgi:hypothetical protein